MHSDHLKEILTYQERSIFARLSNPTHIQDYLDAMPVNFEPGGETYMSPRRSMAAGVAHCFEGALIAAAAVAYHGGRPLLMDLGTTDHDEDHVVALFRKNGYWGAISKTNHSVLRYRDPVYASARELGMSYFHEYFDDRRRKSLRRISAPFSLSKYAPEKWLIAGEELHWLAEDLDASRHFPAVPRKNARYLRRVSEIEMNAVEVAEWNARGDRAYK